jgi:hypothetical protein
VRFALAAQRAALPALPGPVELPGARQRAGAAAGAAGKEVAVSIPLPMTQRSCGGCTACCMVVGVKALAKPFYCPCHHQGEGRCNAYAQRPEDCRDYACFWLAGLGDDADRPDRLGVVLTLAESEGAYYLDVMEVRPGALPALDEARIKGLVESVLAKANGTLGLRFYPYGARVSVDYDAGPGYEASDCHHVGNIFTRLPNGAQVHEGPSDAEGNLIGADGLRQSAGEVEEAARVKWFGGRAP